MKRYTPVNHHRNEVKFRTASLRFATLLGTLLFCALAHQALADEAVNLDGDSSTENYFNPYTFARNPIWIFLPVFGLIIVGLHLMPVPKRKSKNKMDQAQRFFGESARPPVKEQAVDRTPIPDDVTPIPGSGGDT